MSSMPKRTTDPDKPVRLDADAEDDRRGLLRVEPDGPPEIVDAAEQELQTPEDATGEG